MIVKGSANTTGKKKPLASRIGTALLWTMIWLNVTLLISGIYIKMQWGQITVDQMMTNIAGAADGGGFVGVTILWVLIVPLFVTVLLYVGRRLWTRYRVSARLRLAAARRRIRRTMFRAAASTLVVLLVAGTVITGSTSFSSAVQLPTYIKSVSSSMNAADYYRAPAVVGSKDARNIVVVYVESAEQYLTDESLFPVNMLGPIEDETEGWGRIPAYKQYNGGGWTMAGITSTQCGIPLKGKGSATGDKVMNDLAVDDFMPGIDCFGDVLKDEGYKNVFLGGANADFASKGSFLRTHGYDVIKDLPYWKERGEKEEDIRPDWGLSDRRLMEHAKDEVSALHAESKKTGKPFNLSMLTLDSHEPIHRYHDCPQRTGDDELASVWLCSSEAVGGFIHHMEQEGMLEDTAVVVMGDHLKHMANWNVYHEQLDDKTDRSVFNRIWIPGTENGTTPLGAPRAGADQLNMLPTMLEAAGLEIENREAGLGVSVFSPSIPQGSAQALDEDSYGELTLARSSDFYKQVWGMMEPGEDGTPTPTDAKVGTKKADVSDDNRKPADKAD